jgi:hypothetical protein
LPWTSHNFLCFYPLLEEAVIAVHSTDYVNPNLHPQLEWPALKCLTLALEPGIVDLISHLDFPSAEEAAIIFPEWCTHSQWAEIGEGSDTSNQSEYGSVESAVEEGSIEEAEGSIEEGSSEDPGDDSDNPDAIDHLTAISLDAMICYQAETAAFLLQYPYVDLFKHLNPCHPDTNRFDVFQSIRSETVRSH